jgi:DMSO/TMAO reductase YedYZ molybdopterin-dependent catalytic subunit
MSPVPPGTPWGERAVACGRFEGVPLRELLSPPADATEIVFEGADEGEKNGERMRYARSLPVAEAMRPDVLVALSLDGAPLALDHGAPARLLVPGWYGMASVKWLASVRATREPFRGYFQATDYWQRRSRDGAPDAPLSAMRVKSLVVAPGEGERLRAGEPTEVWGWAWSGAGPIHAVEVSRDGGRAWHAATLERPASPYAWTRWSLAWTPQTRGRVTLLSRATDAAGHAQPLETPWNAQGYGNNECGRATVEVG